MPVVREVYAVPFRRVNVLDAFLDRTSDAELRQFDRLLHALRQGRTAAFHDTRHGCVRVLRNSTRRVHYCVVYAERPAMKTNNRRPQRRIVILDLALGQKSVPSLFVRIRAQFRCRFWAVRRRVQGREFP